MVRSYSAMSRKKRSPDASGGGSVKEQQSVSQPTSTSGNEPALSASPSLRLVSLLNTQLGSTIAGVLLGFLLGMFFANYQARTTERVQREARIQEERAALTEEISPWLLEMYGAVSPAASSTMLQLQTPTGLEELQDSIQPFTQVPRTTLLSARLALAFGLEIQSKYDELILMNAEAFSLVHSLHTYRTGPVYTRKGEKIDSARDIARIEKELPQKVETIVVAAYELGERLRTETYGLMPPKVVTEAQPENITCNSAELVGTVTLNGAETDSWFEWGTTEDLGFATGKAGFQTGRSSEGRSWDRLAGLLPGNTYYWRAVAGNVRGIARGEIHRFTTVPISTCR
jgi:hypothetical protein